MEEKSNTPILIIEKPFKNSSLVLCGWCQGKKTVPVGNRSETCPYCQGEGLLCRVTEGTMRLYTKDAINY